MNQTKKMILMKFNQIRFEKKNDSIKSLNDMKNWKFCKTYDWIFEKKNIFSKNTILNNKLTMIIMQSKLSKTKRHERWKFNFNFKKNYNDNIDEIDLSAKVKFQKQSYYVFMKKYVMYDNEKQHITIKKKFENENRRRIYAKIFLLKITKSETEKKLCTI